MPIFDDRAREALNWYDPLRKKHRARVHRDARVQDIGVGRVIRSKLAEQRHLMGVEPAFELVEDVPGFKGAHHRNVAKLKVDQAVKYAEGVFARKGMKLSEELPNFQENYRKMQKLIRNAPNIPRLQMPVIEPPDMKEFAKKLKQGNVDIFKPFAHKRAKFLGAKWTAMEPEEGARWVNLGFHDGQRKDDMVKAQWKKVAASKLKPTQGEIWLELLIENMAIFGVPKPGAFVTKSTIIISKEGYILDGHHRTGQVWLADPSIKMSVLRIPLDIKTLLKVGRSYGGAIGRNPNP